MCLLLEEEDVDDDCFIKKKKHLIFYLKVELKKDILIIIYLFIYLQL